MFGSKENTSRWRQSTVLVRREQRVLMVFQIRRFWRDLAGWKPLLPLPPAGGLLPLLHPPALLRGGLRSSLFVPASSQPPLGLLLRSLHHLDQITNRWSDLTTTRAVEDFCSGLCSSYLSQEIKCRDAKSEADTRLSRGGQERRDSPSCQTDSSPPGFLLQSKKTISSLVLDAEFYENLKIVRKWFEQYFQYFKFISAARRPSCLLPKRQTW